MTIKQTFMIALFGMFSGPINAQTIEIDSLELSLNENLRYEILHRTINTGHEMAFFYLQDGGGTFFERRTPTLDTIPGGLSHYENYFFWDFLWIDQHFYVFAQGATEDCDYIQDCDKCGFYLMKIDPKGAIKMKQRIFIDIEGKSDQNETTYMYHDGFLVSDGDHIHAYTNVEILDDSGEPVASHFHVAFNKDGSRVPESAHYGRKNEHILDADVNDGVRYEAISTYDDSGEECQATLQVKFGTETRHSHKLAIGEEFTWAQVITDGDDTYVGLHYYFDMVGGKKRHLELPKENLELFKIGEKKVEKRKVIEKGNGAHLEDFVLSSDGKNNRYLSYRKTDIDDEGMELGTAHYAGAFNGRLKKINALQFDYYELEGGINWDQVGYPNGSRSFLKKAFYDIDQSMFYQILWLETNEER